MNRWIDEWVSSRIKRKTAYITKSETRSCFQLYLSYLHGLSSLLYLWPWGTGWIIRPCRNLEVPSITLPAGGDFSRNDKKDKTRRGVPCDLCLCSNGKWWLKDFLGQFHGHACVLCTLECFTGGGRETLKAWKKRTEAPHVKETRLVNKSGVRFDSVSTFIMKNTMSRIK